MNGVEDLAAQLTELAAELEASRDAQDAASALSDVLCAELSSARDVEDAAVFCVN